MKHDPQPVHLLVTPWHSSFLLHSSIAISSVVYFLVSFLPEHFVSLSLKYPGYSTIIEMKKLAPPNVNRRQHHFYGRCNSPNCNSLPAWIFPTRKSARRIQIFIVKNDDENLPSVLSDYLGLLKIILEATGRSISALSKIVDMMFVI